MVGTQYSFEYISGKERKGWKREAKAKETDRNRQIETNKKRRRKREAMQRLKQRKVCPGPETYRPKYIHRKDRKSCWSHNTNS